MFNYSSRQKESEAEKRNEDEKDGGEERPESWRNGLNLEEDQPPAPVDGETGESIPEQVSH